MLAGTVVVLAMDQAVGTYDAMMLRGYRGRMPFGLLPAMFRKDRLILFLAPGIILTVYLLCEWDPA